MSELKRQPQKSEAKSERVTPTAPKESGGAAKAERAKPSLSGGERPLQRAATAIKDAAGWANKAVGQIGEKIQKRAETRSDAKQYAKAEAQKRGDSIRNDVHVGPRDVKAFDRHIKGVEKQVFKEQMQKSKETGAAAKAEGSRPKVSAGEARNTPREALSKPAEKMKTAAAGPEQRGVQVKPVGDAKAGKPANPFEGAKLPPSPEQRGVQVKPIGDAKAGKPANPLEGAKMPSMNVEKDRKAPASITDAAQRIQPRITEQKKAPEAAAAAPRAMSNESRNAPREGLARKEKEKVKPAGPSLEQPAAASKPAEKARERKPLEN